MTEVTTSIPGLTFTVDNPKRSAFEAIYGTGPYVSVTFRIAGVIIARAWVTGDDIERLTIATGDRVAVNEFLASLGVDENGKVVD